MGIVHPWIIRKAAEAGVHNSGGKYCAPVKNNMSRGGKKKRKGRGNNYKTSRRGLGFVHLNLASLALKTMAGFPAMRWEQGLFDCCLAQQKEVHESVSVVLSRRCQWRGVDRQKVVQIRGLFGQKGRWSTSSSRRQSPENLKQVTWKRQRAEGPPRTVSPRWDTIVVKSQPRISNWLHS